VKKPRSLRAALLRVILIQATVILIILTGVIALGIALIQNQIIERQQLLINTLARQGDQYLGETDRTMRTLAGIIKNLAPEARQDFLTQARVNYPRFTTLYLVDEAGMVLAEDTDSTTLLGLDLSSTQFFNQTYESEQTFFSEPFISLVTGEIVVTGATPVFVNNQFTGLLVGELSLARLQETIEQVDIGQEGIPFIVDQRGTLVAFPNQQWVQEQRNLNNMSLVQKGLAGENTFEIFYDTRQKDWLIGSVTPMGQNWAVIATQPARLVFRPLQILLTASVLAFITSFALYAVSQRYIAQQIINPISVLAQKVDALSGGQYEPLPADQMGPFAEMITLGQSFNRMVAAVAERTEKLVAANQSLRQSEANLARAQRIAHLGSYSWNLQTNEIFWSEELKLITGITTEKPSFGMTNAMIHPDDIERFSEAERLALEKGQPFDIEYRIIRPDGKVRYIHDQAEVIRDETGKAVEMIGTSLDITERKKNQDKIQAALQEKEALLREIHHRVKNNLQVVCALLDLQAETITDPHPREAFEESRNRVRSMAQIHEQLTHNENLAQVNMASYIDELVSSLRVAYGTETVAIQIDVSEVTLPFDSVSPCGLLINELVSNALKHAFPANISPNQNKIRIVLQHLPKNDQMLELIVADNGVGLPADINLTNPDSLGLTLVNLLIRQLNATLNIERNSGTTFRIVFSP